MHIVKLSDHSCFVIQCLRFYYAKIIEIFLNNSCLVSYQKCISTHFTGKLWVSCNKFTRGNHVRTTLLQVSLLRKSRESAKFRAIQWTSTTSLPLLTSMMRLLVSTRGSHILSSPSVMSACRRSVYEPTSLQQNQHTHTIDVMSSVHIIPRGKQW